MNKELIGYKLKDKKYESAALVLCGLPKKDRFIYFTNNGTNFSAGNYFEGVLKEAGVLDMWFDKVYDEILPKDYTGWVKDPGHPKWLMHFTKGKSDYAIDWEGKWDSSYTNIRITDLRGNNVPATDEDVFDALKREAIKRGFGIGVKWRRPSNIGCSILSLKEVKCTGFGIFIYEKFDGHVDEFFLDGRIIFKDGEWGEIIKDKFEEFEDVNNYVRYKGYCFEKSLIKNTGFKYITSLSLRSPFSKEELNFFEKDLDLIREYAEEKL